MLSWISARTRLALAAHSTFLSAVAFNEARLTAPETVYAICVRAQLGTISLKSTPSWPRTRQCGPHRSWPCWASRTRRTTSATAPWPNGPASIRCADPANATTVERCPQLVAASCAQAEGNGNLYGAKYHAGSVFLAGYQCAVHRLKYRTLPPTAPCPTRPLALS
eukprot:scaffold15427_cov55-Phaeocystis_antarctica.AAC.2